MRQGSRAMAAAVLGMIGLGGLVGCAAAAVGAGAAAVTYAYVEGDTEGYVPHSEQEAIDASKNVLKDTDIIVLSTKKNDQGRTRIKGETETGTNVDVYIRPLDEATFISVRVGLIGDDEASAALFAKIRRELGLSTR